MKDLTIPKQVKIAHQSHGEAVFEEQLFYYGLHHTFEKQYRFWEGRKFAFDFADPKFMIAIEIEGGIWIQGRHNRGSSFEKDMEKYNMATVLGWRLLRFSTKMVEDGIAIDYLIKNFSWYHK